MLMKLIFAAWPPIVSVASADLEIAGRMRQRNGEALSEIRIDGDLGASETAAEQRHRLARLRRPGRGAANRTGWRQKGRAAAAVQHDAGHVPAIHRKESGRGGGQI